jgi:hypothetical protein
MTQSSSALINLRKIRILHHGLIPSTDRRISLIECNQLVPKIVERAFCIFAGFATGN